MRIVMTPPFSANGRVWRAPDLLYLAVFLAIVCLGTGCKKITVAEGVDANTANRISVNLARFGIDSKVLDSKAGEGDKKMVLVPASRETSARQVLDEYGLLDDSFRKQVLEDLAKAQNSVMGTLSAEVYENLAHRTQAVELADVLMSDKERIVHASVTLTIPRQLYDWEIATGMIQEPSRAHVTEKYLAGKANPDLLAEDARSLVASAADIPRENITVTVIPVRELALRRDAGASRGALITVFVVFTTLLLAALGAIGLLTVRNRKLAIELDQLAASTPAMSGSTQASSLSASPPASGEIPA